MIQLGIAAAAVIALIVLISTLFALANDNNKAPDAGPDTVTIPILAGTLQADAEGRLTALGLESEIVEEPSDTVDVGRVIRTTPEEATKVDPGTLVTLVVSSGPDVVEVPDVRGKAQADAKKELEDEGLNVVKVEVDHDPVMAADRATKTDPVAGEELERGADVVLYVASGQVQLTELRNTQRTAAQEALLQLGLVADIQEVETAEHAAGTVFDQSPLPGLVPQNSTVTIKVAKAVSTVGVPDVVGKTQASATGLIEGAGLKAGVTNASSETVAAGRVISQNPAASTQVPLGSTVAIVISTGPADPPVSPPATTPPPP